MTWKAHSSTISPPQLHYVQLWPLARLLCEADLSLSSQRNFFRGPITLFPGFSSSSSSDPFFSPSSDCCLSKHHTCGDLECENIRFKSSLQTCPYFATLAIQSMLYRAICSGITLHTASFSFSSGVRRRSS